MLVIQIYTLKEKPYIAKGRRQRAEGRREKIDR